MSYLPIGMVKPLDVTGDSSGFDCPKHGPFKVTGSVFKNAPTKDAEPHQWRLR